MELTRTRSLQFWFNYRAALIAQYRALATEGDLPAAFTEGTLMLIRAVENHAGLPAYDPAGLTAKLRRHSRVA